MSKEIKRKKELTMMRTRKYRERIKYQTVLKQVQCIVNDNVSTSSDLEQYDENLIQRSVLHETSYGENKNSFEDCSERNKNLSESDRNIDDNFISSNEEHSDNFDQEDNETVINVEAVDNDPNPEIQHLRIWAVQYKIPQAHLDPLLRILRTRLLPSLPKSAKTFLETTQANYQIEMMEDGNESMGEFVYIGIRRGLEACINVSAHEEDTIQLQINADGLSLSKSSSQHIWPILCKVHSVFLFYEPFVVALYFGSTKPKNAAKYLQKFIHEINHLLQERITIANKHWDIQIHCFIADTPARAFLKGVQGHGGFHACERCTVVGSKHERTTCFKAANSEERSDTSFRNFKDPDHHNYPSPLLFITPPINMIVTFVLDFMHLGYLGIMAKYLQYWFSLTSNIRVSQAAKAEVSRRLEQLRAQIPSDFHRKIRTLTDFPNYKAIELKFFALYVGPIVLKGILKSIMYKHFLLFNVGSRLLWCKNTAVDNVELAKNYFTRFFLESQVIYGPQSATLNTHNILHVADDVRNLSCSLSEITAFPFEDLLGKLKRLCRSPNHTVAQLCRRLHEQTVLTRQGKIIPKVTVLGKTRGNKVKKIKYRGYVLSIKAPDNIILLKNKQIININKILQLKGTIIIQGTVWNKKTAIFEVPVNLSRLNMWEL